MDFDFLIGDKPVNRIERRELGSNDAQISYLVNSKGEAYEPYSLAWRYLGMYLSCGNDGSDDDDDDDVSGDQGDDCQRYILWAAYVDPRYKGGQIGEYKFYDIETGTWDDSTCTSKRCKKLDCHERNTRFKLVGVYKETDGLYDFAEQLFKHEGYCVWDEDEYEYMQNYREQFPFGCTSQYMADQSGNSVYYDVQPQGEGNMTFGLYADDKCSEFAQSNFTEYIRYYYGRYYGDESYGDSKAAAFDTMIETWNDNMKKWKICQPCRSYSFQTTVEDNSNDKEGRRFLDDESDGNGEKEKSGYDCYDDAGYLNCNQCYKFETKTSLEEATTSDLAKASAQGTILEIKVNGQVFGSGGFVSAKSGQHVAILIVTAIGMIAVLLLYLGRYLHERGQLPSSFTDALNDKASTDANTVLSGTLSSSRETPQGGPSSQDLQRTTSSSNSVQSAPAAIWYKSSFIVPPPPPSDASTAIPSTKPSVMHSKMMRLYKLIRRNR